MNYTYPFMNPYTGAQTYPGQPMQQIQQPKQAEKVNGRNGAMQYPMGPNSQAWILDESGLISWLILTDSAGYKTVTPYDVTPHEEKPAPDYGSLESRIKRLEEIINDSENSAAAGRRVKDSAAGQTIDQRNKVIRQPAGDSEPAYTDEPEHAAGDGDHTTVWRRR